MKIVQTITQVGAQTPIFFAPETESVYLDINSKNLFKANIYVGYFKPNSYKKLKDKEGLVKLNELPITESYATRILAKPRYLYLNISALKSPIILEMETYSEQQKELAA